MSWCSVVWAAPCLILAILSFSANVAQELGPAPAPSPGLVEAANDTLYFVDATCFGLGRFSGEGTAETGPAGTFRSDDGLNFNGSGLVNSTRGIWTGVGYCQGDALFNVTDPNAYIIGDGSVTGEGLVELDNGTAVELSDGESYTGSNISFSEGAGSFAGVNTFINGSGIVSGNDFTCIGEGEYQGTGSVKGSGTVTGTFTFLGDGQFAGRGVFQGEGYCEGTEESVITGDRDAAIEAGFPSSLTLSHPSATPGPPGAASSK